MRLFRSLIIISVAMWSLPLLGQIESPPPRLPSPPSAGEYVYKVVEDMPRFPGCEDLVDRQQKKQCAHERLFAYVYNNLEYPEAAKTSGKEGTAVISFIVEEDGSLSNIKTVRDPGMGMGDAAAAVLHQMNEEEIRWVPGKQRGKVLRVLFNLPIRFHIQDDKRSGQNTLEEKPAAGAMVEDAPPPPPSAPVRETKPMVAQGAAPAPALRDGANVENNTRDNLEVVPPPTLQREIFKVVEEMPRFNAAECEAKGGRSRKVCAEAAQQAAIEAQLKYPAKAAENGIEGTVVMQAVVMPDGSLDQIKVVRDLGAGTGEEAERVVQTLSAPGSWISGKQRGRPVEVMINLLVRFKLDN